MISSCASPTWRVRGLFELQAVVVVLLVTLLAGCGTREGDAALDSDANGFLCLDCKAKFYTDRTVFANHCPSCQKPNIEMVVGFVCPGDGEVTYAPRGKGAMACAKCGKVTRGLAIPREAELKAWGAAHKTASEVGVQ
jgi:hypothetical protein